MYPVALYQTFALNAIEIGNKIVNLENTCILTNII